ncbi:MAG: Phenylalanyl-tRNA synthetase, partial [Paramarteilia canceri]
MKYIQFVQEEMIIEHLKQNITKILKTFFKNSLIEVNWNYDSFPFTKPSFEVEVIKKESEGIKKCEVGGCGKLQPRVLSNIGSQYSKGWAIGFGLDRLAMLYYDIPDIRILWSAKSEVLDQFSKLEFTDCYQYK